MLVILQVILLAFKTVSFVNLTISFNACYFASYSFSNSSFNVFSVYFSFNACYFASYSFRDNVIKTLE